MFQFVVRDLLVFETPCPVCLNLRGVSVCCPGPARVRDALSGVSESALGRYSAGILCVPASHDGNRLKLPRKYTTA